MKSSSVKNHSQTIKKVYRVAGARLALALKNTPITPNQITLSRIIFVAVASVIIARGFESLYLVAAFLIVIFSMFDALDGSLATEKDQRSVLGAWLDPQVDRLGFLLLFLSVAVNLANTNVFYVYLAFYTLSMFYFRGLIGSDIRLKEKFKDLRTSDIESSIKNAGITQEEGAAMESAPKNMASSIRFLKKIHLEMSPHTHNVALYLAFGVLANVLGPIMLFLAAYLTAWYIWENYKVIKLAISKA